MVVYKSDINFQINNRIVCFQLWRCISTIRANSVSWIFNYKKEIRLGRLYKVNEQGRSVYLAMSYYHKKIPVMLKFSFSIYVGKKWENLDWICSQKKKINQQI